MHFPFKQSVAKLEQVKHGAWHVYIDSNFIERVPQILACLNVSGTVDDKHVLKREAHKLVYVEGPDSELVVKWQRYRDPRRLWKANYFRNQHLTRNEGGMLRTEWMNGCFLHEQGISVPEPLGFIEKRRAGLISEQVIVARNLINSQRLKDHIDGLPNLREKLPWLERTIVFATAMHEHACYHLDFHHRNVLFVREQPYLIDNEKVIYTVKPRLDLLVMMLGRLGFGLRDDPEEQKCYLQLILRAQNGTIDFDLQLLENAFSGKLSGTKLSKLIETNV